MSASCSRTAGAVLRALAAGACGLALLLLGALGAGASTSRHGAGAAGGDASRATVPGLTLVSQSDWVPPGGSFTVVVRRRADIGSSGLGLSLTLYNRLVTEYQFQGALSNPGGGGILSRTATVGLASLAVPGLPLEDRLTLPVQTGYSTSADAIDLQCQTICDGVYPLTITLTRLGSAAPVERLTTFLTFRPSTVPASPLHTALVLPVSVPTSFAPGPGRVAVGTAWMSGADVATACDLVRAIARQRVRVTLEPEPLTVQAMGASCQAGSTPAARAQLSGARAVQDLAEMSQQPSVYQVPAQSFVVTDPSALASAGLGGEIGAQMARGAQVLTATDHIVTEQGSWVLTDGPGGNLRSGLAAVHADQLVVPGRAIVSPPSLTLTQPFRVDLGHGHAVLAAGSNDTLSSLLTADPGDPALAAAQLLAGLSFIQSEEPNASAPRGVVVVPPAGWVPDPALISDVLAGMADNPALVPQTLSALFGTVPVGANGYASTRRLSASTASGISAPMAKAVQRGRRQLAAFTGAVVKAPVVIAGLNDDLLATESSAVPASTRAAGLTAFDHAFAAQVDQITFSADHTVTLTSRRGTLPVTIDSSAPYAVTGQLTVASDRLEFPSGSTRGVTIDRTTNQIRVPVLARTLGDLPIQVTLRTPDGALVIAQSRLTVRSTATSVVGVVLTILAALVLAGWWVRTWVKRRRGAR